MQQGKWWPLGLALTVSTAGATGSDNGGKHHIHDVLVTAPPAQQITGKTLLEGAALESRRAATSDAAALLKGVPGVSLYGAGGVSSMPAIHGLGDDRINIQVDGLSLISACANHMNPPLSYIDPTQVAEMTVYAGVAPVSAGGDNIGGTIIVESARPDFAAGDGDSVSQHQLGSFYRSNGNSTGAYISSEFATRQFSLAYQGAYARADNYSAARDFKPDHFGGMMLAGDEVGSTAYETTNHRLNLAYQHSDDHLWMIGLGYQHIPYQGFPNQRMDMLDNTSVQLRLEHNGTFGWGELATTLFHEHTRHDMNFGDDKQFWYGNAAGMPMETEGKNSGLTVTANLPLSTHLTLVAGTEAQYYRLEDEWPPSGTGMMAPGTFRNIHNGERDRHALFAELHARHSSRWSSITGIRYEAVQMDAGDVQGYNMMYQPDATAFNRKDRNIRDDNVDISALISFVPDDRQAYRLGLSRKTRSPNLYERYSWSTHGMAMRMVNLAGDGNGYTGNIELQPEIAHSISLTADFHDRQQTRWHLSLTPFYTLVDDYIDAVPCTNGQCPQSNSLPGFRYLTFANRDARLYGIDITAVAHLPLPEQYGNLRFSGSLSHVRGKNTTSDDNLYNIAPLQGLLVLEHDLGDWSNRIELQLVDSKNHTASVRNELATAGYGLVNMSTSYSWHQIRVDVGVDNLLNQAHELPLGGAYTGQGQTMSAGGIPYGTAMQGPGRSFHIGVSLTL